jgi:hypothetical protein
MTPSDKLREIAEKYFPTEEKLSNNSLYNQLQQSSRDNLLSDLTALISENYYPKEFVEWKDKNTLSDKISRTEVRYFLKDMDAPLDWMTLDEVFDYWTKNIKQ